MEIKFINQIYYILDLCCENNYENNCYMFYTIYKISHKWPLFKHDTASHDREKEYPEKGKSINKTLYDPILR